MFTVYCLDQQCLKYYWIGFVGSNAGQLKKVKELTVRGDIDLLR